VANLKISNILWRLNSPYGGFVAGDYLDIYYDDETFVFSVEKNGSTVTSGNNIPFRFKYNGLPDYAYKTEKIIQVSVCNGFDLVQFERIQTFPYYLSVTLQNHPTCSVLGEVCDLSFDSLPTVTTASTSTSLDGAITVTASGSNGSVKYKLSDFRYEDGTGQTSGTFSSLRAGVYTVYARDEKNCLAIISVKVEVTKTYGVLYQLEYYDRHGYHHKTQILSKDFAGALTEVKGTDTPTIFHLRGEDVTDKFIHVLPTNLEFNLQTQTNNQYTDLYTSNPNKYRLRHSINSGSGYQVVWTGKVVNNQFQEQYKKYGQVQVIAFDGLADLQNIPFLDDDGNQITGLYKQITIIAYILKKTGLELNIRTACNMYAVGTPSMSTGAANDPLDQAYIDCQAYYIKEQSPNCWDILKYNLEIYGAQIIQYNNVWNIIRIEERVTDFDYREFNSSGVYVSNSTYAPIKQIKAPTQTSRVIWKDQDQTLMIKPGFGTMRLIYDLGRKDNILVNGDFRVNRTSAYQANVKPIIDQVSGAQVYMMPDITGFQIINNGVSVNTSYENLEGGNVAVAFGVTDVGGYLLSDTHTLKMGNDDHIKITYKFKFTQFNLFSTSPKYIKAKIKVTYGTYYLTDSGEWSTIDNNIVFFIKREDVNKYLSLDIIAASPDSLAIDGLDFNVRCYFAHETAHEFDNITYFKAKPTASLPQGVRTEFYDEAGTYGFADALLYYELKQSTNTESLPDIVEPGDYNVSTNPYKWILQDRWIPGTHLESTLYIDQIKVEYLTNGKLVAESADTTFQMEADNNLILEKQIKHGSLVNNGVTNYNIDLIYKQVAARFGGIGADLKTSVGYDAQLKYLARFEINCADIVYAGYLRNSSGDGFVNWKRDVVPEQKPIQEILVAQHCAQYNKPWRQLSGSMTADILFAPIDTLEETMDDDRKYIPVSLDIDFRNSFYTGQFLELTDITDTAGDYGLGFTTGFTTGFDA